MKNNKKPWGKEVDDQLQQVLKKMIEEGHNLSPITRSSVLKRLGLKSRSTLLLNNRVELIENARKTQLKNAGLDESGKKRRRTVHEQLIHCREQLQKAENEKKLLYEKMVAIIYNLNAKGLDVEEIMKPLRY
ncbi:MAG: hypothetical protein KF862_05145 [Chitinophagaceae bacterium]|nr:hypothetical protein [Chitinophagaceae bacterium]